MGERECITCRYRYSCYPCMDDFEISRHENRCNGKDYEKEE